MVKWIVLAVVAFFLLLGGCSALWCVSTYNGMISSNEAVKRQWGQVENVYQRRLDLIPNLVETVKGYATHEKDTLTMVIQARASATQVKIDPSKIGDMAKFQAAQGELSSALARLMVVVEQYPNLKADAHFRELMASLEGTENRIAVERKKFNEECQAYNTKLRVFPSSLIAKFGGFEPRPYFEAEKGSEKAPKVNFK